MKIEKTNRLKDKTLVSSCECHLKANLVESNSGPKFSKLKGTKNLRKNAKLRNKKVVNFKKLGKDKSNNSVNCFVCDTVGHKAY